jgi:hypothetical protein
MSNITKYVIMTAVDANSDAKRTEVSVDFEGFNLEHARTMFFKSTSPRVSVQSALRRHKGGIPQKWSCRAVDFATASGAGERIMTPNEMFEYAKTNPEYMAKLRESLK